MTAVELQNYIESIGVFTSESFYSVEIIDGVIYNRVPIEYNWRGFYISFKIRLYREKFGKKDRCVDFIMNGDNIVGSYELKKLDLPTLCKELNKILFNVESYKIWQKRELRNYILELYEK